MVQQLDSSYSSQFSVSDRRDSTPTSIQKNDDHRQDVMIEMLHDNQQNLTEEIRGIGNGDCNATTASLAEAAESLKKIIEDMSDARGRTSTPE